MFKSMTAYGRSNLKLEVGHIVVEIQSVNRKHLEVAVVLPTELEHFDIEVKKWLSTSVFRGHITVKIFASFENKVPFKVLPNLPLAKQAKQAWDQIADHLQISNGDFDLSMLVNIKDILIIEENVEYEEVYGKFLKQAVDLALKNFMHMKLQEGAVLQTDIAARLVKIYNIIKMIEGRTPYATQRYREKLLARLEQIVPGYVENEERVLREVALFAEKIDITEELTRFLCHVVRFEEVMQSDAPAVGKTLEFILQELNREVNTIGNKSSDLEIARHVIDIKSELERIREQIQNIE